MLGSKKRGVQDLGQQRSLICAAIVPCKCTAPRCRDCCVLRGASANAAMPHRSARRHECASPGRPACQAPIPPLSAGGRCAVSGHQLSQIRFRGAKTAKLQRPENCRHRILGCCGRPSILLTLWIMITGHAVCNGRQASQALCCLARLCHGAQGRPCHPASWSPTDIHALCTDPEAIHRQAQAFCHSELKGGQGA